jgi:hypothetical protein
MSIMSLVVEFPKGSEPLDYIASFAPAFAENENMRSALLGMRDSLRQAELLPYQPLGMLACLTAEEEAASFLYYALLQKGYAVTDHGKLQRHPDKIKVLIIAQILYEYFFKMWSLDCNRRLRLERDIDYPVTSLWMTVNGLEIVVKDPLEIISIVGDGDAGHNAAVDRAIQVVLGNVVPKGMSLASQIKALSNRRNLCLYGDPEKKPKFDASDLAHFTSNSIAITMIGFLVFNGKSQTLSMNKLVENISQKLSSIRP